ncbi:MAG: HEAT repeat domain-containing protein [Pseudobdellovibrionaceae bacterium]|nr:HEAT repeat domain-containing protein [Pseudobdellovibrionaceae bacterium]
MIYSGEGEALDAFVEQALAHKDDGHWQERALPMVGLAPAPTGASWKYLDTMRQQTKQPDVASAAELGMATHLKHGFQDPVFVDELQLRLEKAQTETERLHLLDVVGNAGLEQFFPIISAWLKGASLPLRMRIVQALRFMKRPESETILLEMAAAPEADLALTALQCLRDRTMAKESIPVLLKLLGQTQDDRIRLKVLENLYEARSLDAGLLPKIQNLRRTMAMGQALAEAWEQMEKDWVDPVES